MKASLRLRKSLSRRVNELTLSIAQYGTVNSVEKLSIQKLPNLNGRGFWTDIAILSVALLSNCGIDPLTAGPPAGNPDGTCALPAEAQVEDTSKPDVIVGNGTKESCDSEAVVAAVAAGGIISFNCGPEPLTIPLKQTAKVHNNGKPRVVIDGGGKIALSGEGLRRIIYQNTCDSTLGPAIAGCENQDTPNLTIQNMTFLQGHAPPDESGGGGAIFASGGHIKIVNSRFFLSTCADTNPMGGGGAIRALNQYNGLPVYIVNSTFGSHDGLGNTCTNGGALSGVSTTYTIVNSLFVNNRATGYGSYGGGGGAVVTFGLKYDLNLCGVRIEANQANGPGAAIYFNSGNPRGTLNVKDSTFINNQRGTEQDGGYPGLYVIGNTTVENSKFE